MYIRIGIKIYAYVLKQCPLAVSISRDDAENVATDEVKVDIGQQKVSFKSSPRKSMSKPTDIDMMSPDRIRSPQKRKILTDR